MSTPRILFSASADLIPLALVILRGVSHPFSTNSSYVQPREALICTTGEFNHPHEATAGHYLISILANLIPLATGILERSQPLPQHQKHLQLLGTMPLLESSATLIKQIAGHYLIPPSAELIPLATVILKGSQPPPQQQYQLQPLGSSNTMPPLGSSATSLP